MKHNETCERLKQYLCFDIYLELLSERIQRAEKSG